MMMQILSVLCGKLCDRKHLYWTCTNQTKYVHLAVVYPGANWILTDTINEQPVEAAFCFENIEAMSAAAGDEDAVEFVASAQKRETQFKTSVTVCVVCSDELTVQRVFLNDAVTVLRHKHVIRRRLDCVITVTAAVY